MKKFTKWLGVFAVLACLCLAMVACGDKDEKYVGTYEQGGVTVQMTIVLKKGDKCTQTMEVIEVPEEMKDQYPEEARKPQTAEGTYKIDGDKITFTANGHDTEAKYEKGKSITINIGKEVVLEKK